MAVTFVSSSTSGNAADVSSRAVDVPVGVQSGDIVVVALGQWQSGATPTITPPSGFDASAALTWSSGDGAARNSIWWKRLSAADTGTYTFTWTGGTFWTTVQAVAYRGVLASGDPISTKTTSAVGTFGSITSLSLSTGIASGDGAFWTVYNDSNGLHTPPTGFTETADADSGSTAYAITSGTSITASGASIASSSSAGAAMVVLTQEPAGGTTYAVAGTVTIVAATSGTLATINRVSGVSTCTVGVAGTVRALLAVSATSTVTSTVNGSLVSLLSVAGTIPIDTTTAGAVRLLASVAGTVTMVSDTSGAIERLTPGASGTVEVISTVQGSISAVLSVAGSTVSVTQVSGSVTRIGTGDMATDLLGPVLSTALACADAALIPQVGRAALYPGSSVAWDDCCEGQVWVRLISLTPSGNPANSRNQLTPCGVLMWTATIGVGVLRCAATLDDAGNAPSPALLNADTLQMTQDMINIAEALQCCLAPQLGKLSMTRWDPLGPNGGCVGGEWVATLLIDNCRCG